ncbi:hypothetical protein F5Y14DRAFT_407151 [Nemania sp. NC0429]|nr:hypothetical protein F5Y14DRAFT_407151 [Nemania sp. NC0429]
MMMTMTTIRMMLMFTMTGVLIRCLGGGQKGDKGKGQGQGQGYDTQTRRITKASPRSMTTLNDDNRRALPAYVEMIDWLIAHLHGPGQLCRPSWKNG